MLKWLFEKIIGWPWCAHQWETIEDGSIFTRGHKRPTGRHYTLRCKKCGDVKMRALKP